MTFNLNHPSLKISIPSTVILLGFKKVSRHYQAKVYKFPNIFFDQATAPGPFYNILIIHESLLLTMLDRYWFFPATVS